MEKLTRDDTEHGKFYYLASEVDALLAKQSGPSVRTICESSRKPKSSTSIDNSYQPQSSSRVQPKK